VSLQQAVTIIMWKLPLPIMALAMVAVPASAPAAVLGDDAQACLSGKPSVLVRVSGFKAGSGRVKIGLYEAGRYLQKKGTVTKETVAVRSRGAMDVCLAVPRAGRYAVAVHHDLNGNGNKDANDGAGYSNNPRLSLTNLKPPFGRTAVSVGGAPRRVEVVLQYRRGLSVGPVNG
jgi:uncharacterized protein (DUF2141 family)